MEPGISALAVPSLSAGSGQPYLQPASWGHEPGAAPPGAKTISTPRAPSDKADASAQPSPMEQSPLSSAAMDTSKVASAQPSPMQQSALSSKVATPQPSPMQQSPMSSAAMDISNVGTPMSGVVPTAAGPPMGPPLMPVPPFPFASAQPAVEMQLPSTAPEEAAVAMAVVAAAMPLVAAGPQTPPRPKRKAQAKGWEGGEI